LLRSLFLILLFVLSGGVFASTLRFCPTDISTGATKDERKDCQKKWTVLIFMAADNDLTPYALLDLSEMERQIAAQSNLGASGPQVDVVVELDTHMFSGIRRLHMQQHATAVMPKPFDLDYFKAMPESALHSPVLEFFEEDSDYGRQAVNERFRQFLLWGVANFPSENLMVVVWGHGEGYIGMPSEVMRKRSEADYLLWEEMQSRFLTKDMLTFDFSSKAVPTQFPGKNIFGGVAFDASDGSYISMPQLKNSLQEVATQNRPTDILAFDACLMQSVEVASELQGAADIVIGSVQIQDYVGLPYRSLLDLLNQQPRLAPYQVAKKLVTLAKDSYAVDGYQYEQAPRARETFTLSALELNEFARFLLPELARLSQAIENYVDEDNYRQLDLGFLIKNSPKFLGESRELGIFLGSLKKLLYQESIEQYNGEYSDMAAALLIQIDRTLDGLNRSLLEYAYGDAYIAQSQHQSPDDSQYLLGFFKGVSLWIPDSTKLFDMRYNEFAKSALYRYQLNQGAEELAWHKWLEKIMGGKGPMF
jgi:hypothetical protein